MQQGGRGNRAAPVGAMQHVQLAGQQLGAAAEGSALRKRDRTDNVLAMDADGRNLLCC